MDNVNWKLIKKGVIGIRYWIEGHLIARKYDKKYLRGKWFQGKMHGLCAQGWKWVVDDYKGGKRIGIKNTARWPVSPRIHVVCPENIYFHPDNLNIFQGIGNYYQALGKITIGRGTYIGPNVGIITSNHCAKDLDLHDAPKPVEIGEKCWIGMNSVILPGVKLGRNTIVGAGSIVTKSFPDGDCVIAGNPAKLVKRI